MPRPIEVGGDEVDLSGRYAISTTVAASPSGASETIIAQVTIPGEVAVVTGVYLEGFAAYTVGTSGVSGNLKIRRTNVSGTTVVATGALTVAAGNLVAPSVNGFDANAPSGTVYCLTLTVGSGAAASTVSAVCLTCVVL